MFNKPTRLKILLFAAQIVITVLISLGITNLINQLHQPTQTEIIELWPTEGTSSDWTPDYYQKLDNIPAMGETERTQYEYYQLTRINTQPNKS